MNERQHFFADQDQEIKLFVALAAIILFLLVVSLVAGNKDRRRDISVPTGPAMIPFPEVELGARAAYVYDVRAGQALFAKNEDLRLPLASLTKVMTALVAEELSPPNGTIVVTAEALGAEGDSGLRRDEKWSLRALLDFSLVVSSNDGARAVALALGALSKSSADSSEILSDFVRQMNEKAREIGLKNTYFWNETGLDESEIKGGAYGTARDMSALVEYILVNRPEVFSATREVAAVFRSFDNNAYMARNTNILAGEIPGLLASKTGYTFTAGGNLVVAFDPELGRPFIISVLGATERGRFEDMRTLVGAVMEYIGNN